MIPAFGAQLPAIATAAVWGILLNLVLRLTEKKPVEVKPVKKGKK
jgi:uracil permease